MDRRTTRSFVDRLGVGGGDFELVPTYYVARELAGGLA